MLGMTALEAFLFCLPFCIYPSRRQYSVPNNPHILPDVSILCQMTHITCCLRKLSRDCHSIIPVNCKQPEWNVRVWEMRREFVYGTSFCSLRKGVLGFYLYIFWELKAYICSVKASVTPRVFFLICVRRTPNEAI